MGLLKRLGLRPWLQALGRILQSALVGPSQLLLLLPLARGPRPQGLLVQQPQSRQVAGPCLQGLVTKVLCLLHRARWQEQVVAQASTLPCMCMQVTVTMQA